MKYALRIGRLGSLTIYLNYTWLFGIVLGLWWLALLWLPDHLPGWRAGEYWLAAVLVLVLYFFSLLAHEAVHSVIGRTGPRNIVLYPTGAAQPFRVEQVDPGRGVFSALIAPLFNLVLGGLLLILGSGITPGNPFIAALKGIFEPLGWLNLVLGIINFIPGIPFDGGWALSAGIYWFNGDRESGISLARSVGGFASLALVLLGAWRGLTTNSWIDSLALVLVGWSANDAGNLSRERTLLRGAFNELRTRDLLVPSRPEDHIHEGESVAALVAKHPRFPPGEPIAVLDGEGKLVGLVTLTATEALLQGSWATTPVRSIATSLEEAHILKPGSSLNEAIAIYESRPTTDTEELSIPVIEDGQLIGSLSPSRLNTFTGIAEQFGVEETLDRQARMPDGLLRLLGRVLPPLILITVLAILGNIALHTNPAEFRGSTDETTEAPIIFSTFNPPDGSIVGLGPLTITVDLASPSAITTATLTLDGKPIEAAMSGASPLIQTLSGNAPGLTQGFHTVEAKASLESGRSKRAEWQFLVNAGGEPVTEPTAVLPVEPTLAPTPTVSVEAPQISSFTPQSGGQLLDGATNVLVGVNITSTQPLSIVTLLLDGNKLDAQNKPRAGHANSYSIYAFVPTIGAGVHRARAEVSTGISTSASEWTFSAIAPDASNMYVNQTDKFISEPFLTYWRNNGSVAVFGYPISGRIIETYEPTGEQYTAQYFERARFELHSATGNQVILGTLGALIHPLDPPVDPIQGQQYFQETKHNLGGDFLAFWNSHGGLAVFGYPFSEQITEKNPTDGKEYSVQYFERNRFELHPDAAPADRVQLGLLGSEIYSREYGAIIP